MKRTFTEVGKEEYSQEEINQSIDQVNWEAFRTTDLPFCQGECLKTVIKGCGFRLSTKGGSMRLFFICLLANFTSYLIILILSY